MLPNISRSKDNQTMKFDQSIENNLRNIFVEKSYTKCDGESIPRQFSKKFKIEFISGSVVLKFYTVCIYCMVI